MGRSGIPNTSQRITRRISQSCLGIRYHIPLLFLGINWDAPESQKLLKEFPCYSAMSRLKTLFRTCFLYHIPKEFSNVSEFNLKELFRAKNKRILPEFFEKFLFWQCQVACKGTRIPNAPLEKAWQPQRCANLPIASHWRNSFDVSST